MKYFLPWPHKKPVSGESMGNISNISVLSKMLRNMNSVILLFLRACSLYITKGNMHVIYIEFTGTFLDADVNLFRSQSTKNGREKENVL